MNTIQEQWTTFQSLTLPKDAPPTQIQEMRRAFYGGAQAMLNIQHVVGDPNLSEEAGLQILEGVVQECQQFAQDIREGRA